MPQLVKRNRVPIPVVAATSVLTVIVVVAAASFAQISALIAAGGVNAVPWNLVAYTIPGVIIGGQIGPRLQAESPTTPWSGPLRSCSSSSGSPFRSGLSRVAVVVV